MDLISEAKLRVIADQQKKNLIMLEKDYFLTVFLSLIQHERGLYFKGGTAINKIFLDHIRLSEDLDFTITIPIEQAQLIIERIIKENNKIFSDLSHGKSVDDFTRFIVRYNSYFDDNARLILDLNKRAKLVLEPEICAIPNYYAMHVDVHILNRKELIAEKVCALMNRNRPRDYFDVYQIIQHHIPIDLALVEKKAIAAKQDFSVIKIFQNAKKVYKRWNRDLMPLTDTHIPFETVMRVLKDYFNYMEKKRKLKES